MTPENVSIKRFIKKLQKVAGDPFIDVTIDGLKWQLSLLREQAKENLRQNLINVRAQRKKTGRTLKLRDCMGIDERFLHIGHFLADWGFCPRNLLIRYGCTDKDITQWKADKLIVAGRSAYRATPHAQTTTIVNYYSLTPKGQNYLRQHHIIWSGTLEKIYQQALQQKGIDPVFTKPAMNLIAPQTTAVLVQSKNPNRMIFGRAMIQAKIHHVLGLPIPHSKDAWRYDAILCALPMTIEEIDHNLHYYRHWVAQLTSDRDRQLAEIDQEMKDRLQYFLDYPENHYYYCLKHGLSMDEEPNQIRQQAQNKRDDVNQAYEKALKHKTGKLGRALVLEYERSYKNSQETDNFVVKLNALAASDARALIMSPTEKRKTHLKNKVLQRYQTGYTYKWEKVRRSNDFGSRMEWVPKKVTLSGSDHLIFDVWSCDQINSIAGFAFSKQKKNSK